VTEEAALANEARVTAAIQITTGNYRYQSPQPTAFFLDVAGAKGPTPGAITATTSGTNVDLSGLTSPGLCWISNLDATNYVEVGIHDGALFHPLLEIPPGAGFPLYLSRNLGVEEDVPGTGTSGVINSLCVRAHTASCVVRVEASER
jgi:hypothetical protein